MSYRRVGIMIEIHAIRFDVLGAFLVGINIEDPAIMCVQTVVV